MWCQHIIMRGMQALLLAFSLIASPAQAMVIQEVSSKSGVKAWLVEDHRTPLVTLSFAFRGGVEQDTPQTQGLSNLLADLLTEGAGKRDAAAFQQALADHGVSFGLEAGRDSISGTLMAQTEELPMAVELARDALHAPRFDAAAIERVKQQTFGAIKAQLADPAWQARRALLQTMFPEHPYAYRSLGTTRSLNALTAAQLRTAATQRLAKDNLLVAVVGDITAAKLKTLLESVFGALPAKAQLRPVADIAAPTAGKTLLLPQAGGQALLVFAAPGLKRNDPDWHAASVLNYTLGGGGFASRLMAEVRDQRGLTYGIDTSLAAMAHSGLLMGDARTANDKAGEAWDVTRGVWETVWREGLSALELDAAKNYLIGALPTGFTSSGAIAGMLLAWQKDSLPRDYLTQRAAALQAVTLADIARVAKRLLDPARLTLVVTGEPSGISPTTDADSLPFVTE
jgi:zinc protease